MFSATSSSNTKTSRFEWAHKNPSRNACGLRQTKISKFSGSHKSDTLATWSREMKTSQLSWYHYKNCQGHHPHESWRHKSVVTVMDQSPKLLYNWSCLTFVEYQEVFSTPMLLGYTQWSLKCQEKYGCSCTQGLFSFLQNVKFFKIFRHIESLDTCMKH